MYSVVPTRRVSIVSGRTTTHTVALVPASSLVLYAERTSWRRSCCCSVSTVIGRSCLLELHMHKLDTKTEEFMRAGNGLFMHFSCHKLFHNILDLLKSKHGCVFMLACADGSMLSVRVCTQKMRWNKLQMRALHAPPALHMFQNPWVSLRTTPF